jgi:hypothetical protein
MKSGQLIAKLGACSHREEAYIITVFSVGNRHKERLITVEWFYAK